MNAVKFQNKKMKIGKIISVIALLSTFSLFTGCVENNNSVPRLIQTGSSTVLPLAIAWAEEFDGADISVSGGGSSHGLNSLLNGEADLGDASRLMKGSDYEKMGCDVNLVNEDGTASAACNGVLPTKWVVAYDVLSVIVNNDNDFAIQLNYNQLYEIFTDDNPAIYWDEVTGLKEAPHEKIEIYAPDEASGTYDFFFESIIPSWGKDNQEANTRLDYGDGVYHPSADDNVIINAVKDNEFAIGYFGFAYYKENPTLVKTVWLAEDSESDFQEPSLSNVANYPMARPLHIYTDGIPKENHVINEYLYYILTDGQDMVSDIGYVKVSSVDQNIITDQINKL